MSRKFSNNEVKRAGKVLSCPSNYTSAELEDAQNTLTYWRTIHAAPINTFQANLRTRIRRLGFKDALVAQRLKRAVSIVAKLERFPNMKLSTMQDIAGLRAIVKNISEVRELENKYRKSSFLHELIDKKDYITTPAPSGYRGIHLIYQYVNPTFPESNGLKIEVQLRTKLQHAWATAVETVGTFLNYSLKSSQGPEDWLDYFSLVSAGFCHLENCPVEIKYQELSTEEVFERISSKSRVLEVFSKLRGFSVAANHIVNKAGGRKYNLITLNLEKKVVNIRFYSESHLEQANIDYTNIEKEINKGARIQAVLVSTGSIDSLRKAYPSYFLDTDEFLNKLRLIENRLKKMKGS